MTPLAHEITKQRLLPKAMRIYDEDTIALTQDIHCFDITEALDLSFDLARTYAIKQNYDKKLVFLPAPRTWIEFKKGNPPTTFCYMLTETEDEITYRPLMRDEFMGFNNPKKLFSITKGRAIYDYVDQTTHIIAILALINHPKIVGRRQYMPHRGLERRLVQKLGIGKFPLHGWTELKLHVTPTIDARNDDPSIEAHYTGHKCLHFCRAHLRLWYGELLFVNAHWRGDPALGIKQTRYKVVA